MSRLAPPMLVVLLAACGQVVVGEPRSQPPVEGPVQRGEWMPPAAPEAPEPEHRGRFVGPWLIDQPYHALYEASVYDFRADGTLVHVKTWTYGDKPEDYETGMVSDAEWKVICRFGSSWRSEGDATLVVAGACTDGVAREIALGFNDDPSANVWDAGARVVSVGGVADAGWDHHFPEWRWAKCASLDACHGVEGVP